jgi:hypothetical protein
MDWATAPLTKAALSSSPPAADPMTKSKSTNIYIHCRVTQALSASLQDCANKDDRSLSYVIRKALNEYLQARGYSPDAN